MRGMGDYYHVAAYVDDLVISTRTTNERTAAQYNAIQQVTTVCPAGYERLERERSSPTRMLSSTQYMIGGTGMSGRDNGCDRARADYTIAKQE